MDARHARAENEAREPARGQSRRTQGPAVTPHKQLQQEAQGPVHCLTDCGYMEPEGGGAGGGRFQEVWKKGCEAGMWDPSLRAPDDPAGRGLQKPSADKPCTDAQTTGGK